MSIAATMNTQEQPLNVQFMDEENPDNNNNQPEGGDSQEAKMKKKESKQLVINCLMAPNYRLEATGLRSVKPYSIQDIMKTKLTRHSRCNLIN